MNKYILIKSYFYNMSSSIYEDYQPSKYCVVYDELNKANSVLENLLNNYHQYYSKEKYYNLQEDGSYYSEKYDETVYPPQLYKIEENGN